MDELLKEYHRLTASLRHLPNNEAKVAQHVALFASFADSTGSAMTIYNSVIGKTVYRSANYLNLFGAAEEIIHPDDLREVLRGAVVALQYFSTQPQRVGSHRLIRKYRARVKGEYCVVIEQVQPLEYDEQGCVWLSYDVITVAPHQQPPYVVDFQLINFETGEIITPLPLPAASKPLLSKRETEVLGWIDKGLLSKEISERLCISVHTVNTHRQRILEKLNVGTSIEAIKQASALGVL